MRNLDLDRDDGPLKRIETPNGDRSRLKYPDVKFILNPTCVAGMIGGLSDACEGSSYRYFERNED